MVKRAVGPIITGLVLDRDAAVPLHRQVYEGVRRAILSRHFSPGQRLPSTRTVASDLGISRYTVGEAFLQLLAEGYIEGKIGSGTYVTRTVPEDLSGCTNNGPQNPTLPQRVAKFERADDECHDATSYAPDMSL